MKLDAEIRVDFALEREPPTGNLGLGVIPSALSLADYYELTDREGRIFGIRGEFPDGRIVIVPWKRIRQITLTPSRDSE